MRFEIKFHPLAEKEFGDLDGSNKKLVLKQLKKLEQKPYLGDLLGNKKGLDLTNYRKLYINKKKIRIVYKIFEKQLIVYIISIGNRDKFKVYENAFNRIE